MGGDVAHTLAADPDLAVVLELPQEIPAGAGGHRSSSGRRHRRRALDEMLLNGARLRVPVQALDFAKKRSEPPHDAPSLGHGDSERGQRLLALNAMLDQMRGEAVQAEAHVHVELRPLRGPGHDGHRERVEPTMRLRARRAHPFQHVGEAARHVDLGERGHPVVGHAHGIGVGALRRVERLHGVAPLDHDDVAEGLPDRPLPVTRRSIQEGRGQADEEAAEVAERALGKGENAPRLRVVKRGELHVRPLGVFQRAVDRIADIGRLVPKAPGARELRLVEGGEAREGGVDVRPGRHRQSTERTSPPSTRMVVPVMYPALPEARKATRYAISFGSPIRPIAVSAARWARAASTEMPSSLARAVTLESMRSVRMEPGHTLFTRMPSRPTSSARLLAKATTPMRVAPERARLGMGWYTVLANTLMMRPPPCLFICGTTSRHIRAKKTRERCTAVAHCSSVAESARASGGPPELFTRMSRRPKRSTVEATRWRTVSAWSRSPVRARTSAPVASRIDCAARSRSAGLRLHTASDAPSSASTSAQARPRPLLPPPTMATLPLSSRSMASALLSSGMGSERTRYWERRQRLSS